MATATTKFEPGKSYGNDLTIEVLKRTEKTVTIKTIAWGVSRVKIRNYHDGEESIVFKAWSIGAGDNFDSDVAQQNSFERAYYS